MSGDVQRWRELRQQQADRAEAEVLRRYLKPGRWVRKCLTPAYLLALGAKPVYGLVRMRT